MWVFTSGFFENNVNRSEYVKFRYTVDYLNKPISFLQVPSPFPLHSFYRLILRGRE